MFSTDEFEQIRGDLEQIQIQQDSSSETPTIRKAKATPAKGETTATSSTPSSVDPNSNAGPSVVDEKKDSLEGEDEDSEDDLESGSEDLGGESEDLEDEREDRFFDDEDTILQEDEDKDSDETENGLDIGEQLVMKPNLKRKRETLPRQQQRVRSKNEWVDMFLDEEPDVFDNYADLEDFIVWDSAKKTKYF